MTIYHWTKTNQITMNIFRFMCYIDFHWIAFLVQILIALVFLCQYHFHLDSRSSVRLKEWCNFELTTTKRNIEIISFNVYTRIFKKKSPTQTHTNPNNANIKAQAYHYCDTRENIAAGILSIYTIETVHRWIVVKAFNIFIRCTISLFSLCHR